MENQQFQNANEYIEHQYAAFFGDLDRQSYPQSILEDFDMKYFCKNALHRDIYNLLMNSDPLCEYEKFYNLLDTTRDKEAIKGFSFSNSSKIQSKFKSLYDSVVECSMEEDKYEPEAEKKDSTEVELITYVDVLYSREYKRIIKLMSSLEDKCKSIASSIDNIDGDELDKRQVEILILLEDIKDKNNLDPDLLLRRAASILKQVSTNVLDDTALNNLI